MTRFLKINKKKNQEQLMNKSRRETMITKSLMMKSQSRIKPTWMKYLILKRMLKTRIKELHKWIMLEVMLRKLL